MKRTTTRRIGKGLLKLEDRVLMAADMFVRTDRLDSTSISPGGIAILSEFEMIGAQNSPNQIVFAAKLGSTALGSQYQLRADMRDANGAPGIDGIYETLANEARIGAAGNIVFDLNANFGRTLARNGTPLQVQGRINSNASAGQLQLGKPWIGYPRLETRPNTFQIGAKQNPVFTIRPTTTNNVSYALSGASGTFSPGDNDVSLGTLTVNSTPGNGYYIFNQFLAIEGRGADNAPLPNVSGLLQDVEVRNTATGAVSHGTTVANIPGLSIVRFSNIYVDGTSTFEVRADQEGTAATSGQKFRAHLVTELSSSANTINIAGLTGPTTDYRLQAFDADGRDTLVVSPGGVLAGNFKTVAVPTMNVAVKATGSANTAVRNQQGITLMAFDVGALGSSVLFTGVDVSAKIGSLANVTNAALWVDTDRNGAVDTVLQRGSFLFQSLIGGGYAIPSGEQVRFEVRADVASSLASPPTLQVEIVPGSVHGERLDSGASLLSGQITLDATASATNWSFVTSGSLFIEKDSMPVRSQYLLGGAIGTLPIARYELTALDESIDVTDFAITVPGNAASIKELNLLVNGGVIVTATITGAGTDPVPVSGKTFWANMDLQQLIVPKGTSVDVSVIAVVKTDVDGAVSGEAIQPNLVTTPNFVGIQARGVVSSVQLSRNDNDSTLEGEVVIGRNSAGADTDIMGTVHTVTMAKVMAVQNANPAADGTNVPTGISPIGQWRITAADHNNSNGGHNKVEIVKPVIMISAANVLINADGFRFYDKADSSTVATNIIVRDGLGNVVHGNVTGTFYVEVDLRSSTINREIGRGENETFVLEASIINPKIVSSRNAALETALLLDETDWADPDALVTGADAFFTGLGLSEILTRSTRYFS